MSAERLSTKIKLRSISGASHDARLMTSPHGSSPSVALTCGPVIITLCDGDTSPLTELINALIDAQHIMVKHKAGEL